MILEGWRIAPGASRGRKVRTPQGATPRNPGLRAEDILGRNGLCLSPESATENQTAHRLWPAGKG